MKVQLSSEIFTVINPEYNYRFSVDSEVARWVQFQTTVVELEPGQSRSVTYDIAVPLGAEPGGQYISIFASTDSEQQQGAITSRQRIASLIYITVDGDVTRNGVFLSLSHPWLAGDSTDWSASIQNQGTTHFRSRYAVEVRSLIGNSLVAKSDGEALILPGTIRRISDGLPLPAFPGVYRVTYSVGLGDQPAQVEARIQVYLPAWLWVSVVVGLIIAALLSVRRKKSTA
jgi:hypothetical protein